LDVHLVVTITLKGQNYNILAKISYCKGQVFHLGWNSSSELSMLYGWWCENLMVNKRDNSPQNKSDHVNFVRRLIILNGRWELVKVEGELNKKLFIIVLSWTAGQIKG
jgi:hypothetical protein